MSQRGNYAQGDHFSRRARAAGAPARSIYKLEEIDQRWHLLRPGGRVLDLGCAPGSWLQYAAQAVGQRGQVLGIDLKPLRLRLGPQVETRIGDAFALALGEAQFDAILSDMAPNTMGDRRADAARSAGLAEHALELADRHGAVGSHVVVKVLEGGDLPGLVQRLRGSYRTVTRLRPQATRSGSTEIFLVGQVKLAASKVGAGLPKR